MSQLSLKDEIQRIKLYLVGRVDLSGIFLNRDSNLGISGDESEVNLSIFVDSTEKRDQVSSLLSGLDEKPLFPYSIHLWEELNHTESGGGPKALKDGKLIYWNSLEDLPANQIFKTKLHALFTFELTHLIQTAKAKFNYQIYGKKGKGLLSEWEGKRLTKSCFYVPYKYKFKVIRFLTSHEISYKAMEIWI